jgi:H+-translocating NAD(P) transhydrogenase subunit alpha
MIIGVLREPSYESRVSVLPEMSTAIIRKGVQVLVEAGAGEKAFAADGDYALTGAVITARDEIIRQADVILSMHQPDTHEWSQLTSKVIIGIFQPLFHPAIIEQWASLNISSFSLDMLPRTTRAQSMDVLSSQANIAGYKAVLTAANVYSRYFPMLMTAAGSIAPAKVLILGAGVAGLQAIATAKRLGSVVEVFDTRPAVKEEVMSLGAKFVEVEGAADSSSAGGYAVEQTPEFMQRQKDKIAESIAKADIVISTAQIPGKRAPILITTEMIAAMKKGAVIVDLAAATGGNSELTVNNETIVHHGVTIIGNSALPSSMPSDASKLYGKNVFNFLQLIISKEGTLNLNFADDLVAGCCITHNGAVVHERMKALIAASHSQ